MLCHLRNLKFVGGCFSQGNSRMQTLLITRPNGQYDHRPFRPWKSSASPAKLCLFTIFPKLSFAHPLSCYAIFTSSENQTKVFQIKNSTDFIRKINSSSMCNNKNQINELNKKNNVCLRRGNGQSNAYRFLQQKNAYNPILVVGL